MKYSSAITGCSGIRVKPVLWIAVALTWLLCIASADGAETKQPLTLAQYRSAVQSTLARVEAGDQPLSRQDVGWLKKRFPVGLKVRDRSGVVIEVERETLRGWIDQAGSSKKARKELAVYLRTLDRQVFPAAAARNETTWRWSASREALEQVYRLPEFRGLDAKPPFDWSALWLRMLKAIERWLTPVLERMGLAGEKIGRYVDYTMRAVLLLLLILVTVRAVRVLRSYGHLRWRPASGKAPPSKPVPVLEREWPAWRRDAAEKARQGAFREAIRCLFVSMLLRGHEAGWWVYRPQATNREHLGRWQGPAERRESFRLLIDAYEKTWYGLGRAGEQDYRSFEDGVKRLEGAL